MLGTPARCYVTIKYWNSVLALGSNNFGPALVGIAHQTRAICRTPANCKKDPSKTSCCQDVPQTEGRKVEPWPKYEPTAVPWRAECPREPVPPNYDPYRIRVPDVVVPPLPPSNAKELPNEDGRELFCNQEINFGTTNPGIRDLFHNSPIIHPDYWKDKPARRLSDNVRDVLPKLGYHGKTKYKYAFHEPWKPLDRLTLLAKAEVDEADKAAESAAIEKSGKQIV